MTRLSFPNYQSFAFLLLLIFSNSSIGQTRAPLRDMKAVYQNIESPAKNKVKIAPSTKIKTLELGNISSEVSTRARSHVNAPENVALMLIENGKVIFEEYGKGSSSASRFASLSMSKGLVSLAIGHAYCSGHIKSLDDSAEIYASELKETPLGKASVRDLLRMNSGVITDSRFHGQSYENSGAELLLHKNNISKLLQNYSKQVGVKRFNYSNMDTHALNFVIRGATKSTLADWLKSTVIDQAGFESDSYWALDANNVEISPSFFFASLKDWGRLALYIDQLTRDDGKECLSKYVIDATSSQIDANTPEFQNYGYHFFVNSKGNPDPTYWMVGFGGQRIAFDKNKNKIMINFSWSHETKSTFEFFNEWTR